MKNLIITLLAAFSLQAFAKEVTIVDESLYKIWPAQNMVASFNYNSSLERAWVEVEFSTMNSDGWDGPESLKVKVEGLYYDSARNAVVMENEGQEIVCAYKKKTFMGYILKETKKCKFKTTNYNKIIDDGFEMKKVPYLKLVLKY